MSATAALTTISPRYTLRGPICKTLADAPKRRLLTNHTDVSAHTAELADVDTDLSGL